MDLVPVSFFTAELVNARQETAQVGTIGSTIADGLHMTIVCDAMGCHNRSPLTWRRYAVNWARIIASTWWRGPKAASALQVAATLGDGRAIHRRDATITGPQPMIAGDGR